jgi:preprotein translocase subunit SecE
VAKSKSRSSSSSGSSSAAVSTREPHPLVRYFQETRAELRKVTWPTREETKNLTLIIVTATVAMAVFLGTLDYIFQVVVAGVVASDFIRIGIAVLLLAGGGAAFYFNSQDV